MRNIRLDLEYNGQNYCGWQYQPQQPTIEAAVKNAVETMIRHPIVLYSSGRTDAGVHAEQHVAHFFSDTKIEPIHILGGLNSLLPDDIVVYHVMDMPLNWRARWDAVEREYRYTYYNDIAPTALYRDRTYWIRAKLNVENMRRAAQCLIGEHDFSAFRNIHCDANHPVRTIDELSLVEEPPLLRLRVRGNAFLRHQVRIIAGTLLWVGWGKIEPEAVKEILDSKNRDNAGETLAARGLTLVAVRYKDDIEPISSTRPVNRF